MRSTFYFLFISILFFCSNAAAATYVVDRADDVTATACTAAANDCSLRGAIINANANGAGADTINFNIGGGNAQTITISSTPLPDIQTSLTIDGTTQPLWGGLPLIEINGAASTAGTNGFRFTTPVNPTAITVVIKGLIINRFAASGINFNASFGVTATVTGCYIGTNPGGSVDQGNGADGIRITAYPGDSYTIGGTATSDRNVISGNQLNGIDVITVEDIFSQATTDITVLNNFIGTSAGGSADLGNSTNGIAFGGPGYNFSLQVGNGLASGRNIISGNDQYGIFATSGSIGVFNNYIGTNLGGTTDVGNTLDGIKIATDVTSAVIGGTVVGIPVGNVISGNNGGGIFIDGADIPATIQGNKIGTNAAGTAALGNNGDGIYLSEGLNVTLSSITIGSSTDANNSNTISGNGQNGIEVNELVQGVKIYGNKIGTNTAGTAVVPNGAVGVMLNSSLNEIGLAGSAIAANVISGNGTDGILLFGTGLNAINNKIHNNYIGTNAATQILGNGQSGIYINGAYGTEIGDNAVTGRNTIAFNGTNGVTVYSGGGETIRNNSIYGNFELGIDLGGDGPTPNDPGDADNGPNLRQNYPVIQRATTAGITATINTTPNTAVDIEYFYGPTCDTSGFGEGQIHLAGIGVTTDANGNADVSVQPGIVTVGQFVTATATTGGAVRHTSEFSQCAQVTPPVGNLTFSAASYTAVESAGQRTIVVNRTGGSYGTIQAHYATSNGTATAGQDYSTTSNTITFLDGELTHSFNVPITNDTTDEADETVNLTLSNPSPGVFLTPNATAVLTITDDDPPPTISIEDVAQTEGNQGNKVYFFRVELSQASEKTVTVDYQTTNGTATATVDYLPTNGTLTFAPGETLKEIIVTIVGDLTPELDETFTVDLSNPQNVTFGDNQGVGTIQDDDNPGRFSFAFAPYSGTEHDTVLVTVTRTNGTAGTVSVDYATQGGTATPVTDYQPASGTLVFGDGETTKTFPVILADDTVPEPAKTVNLVLSNPIGGAILGAPSVAVLNIFDNDSGALLTLAGRVHRADNSNVAGVTMTLQGTQNATATTDASGRYSFPNLAPNGNYSVTPAAVGYTFAPISQQFNNLTSDNLVVNFTATPAPARQLKVVGGNATPGQNVTATVQLVAQGDENSVAFSLNYDSNILVNPQVALGADAAGATLFTNSALPGRLGIVLALPAGQSFAVGTRTVAVVTFNTLPTAAYNSPVTFGDAPLARSIANTNADELTAVYTDGAVTFAQGYEADVAPRPTGNNNGTVTITDFTQVGRFVAGLDTLNDNFNEFQRADCAPRITLGNGTLTVADYTQAGRFAAGLDPVSPTGGAAAPNLLAIDDSGKLPFAGGADNFVPTIVQVVSNSAQPGSPVTVVIAADTQGTENGFGFTVNYDPTKLANPTVAKGADTQAATLIPNTTQSGKVGVVLAMPFGQAIAAGTKQIVTIQFNVLPNAAGGPTPLVFTDAPVAREISDVNANVLQSTFTDGAVNILTPTAAGVTVGGQIRSANGGGLGGVRVTLTDASGQTRTATSNTFGRYEFRDVPAGAVYVLTAVGGRRYAFAEPTRVVSVGDDLADIDFVSAN
ncbi:MAG: carboxypeptidase regulatory-like domain-containing protein [Acidobacteria bacterium]|nr:carboxypeptidase regulatory-like domain-containing protein [Acidobacteriota bacterium]